MAQGNVNQRVLWNDKKAELTFCVDTPFFDHFIRNNTKGELYLPLTKTWKERLLDGRKLKKEIRERWTVVVKTPDGDSFYGSIIGADIRLVPLRAIERTDKHIVLFTKFKQRKNEKTI